MTDSTTPSAHDGEAANSDPDEFSRDCNLVGHDLQIIESPTHGPLRVACAGTCGQAWPVAQPSLNRSTLKPYAPEIAKLIHVERVGSSFRLEINGEPFPYHLTADSPIIASMDHEGIATLRITLMADRVEFVDQPYQSGGLVDV